MSSRALVERLMRIAEREIGGIIVDPNAAEVRVEATMLRLLEAALDALGPKAVEVAAKTLCEYLNEVREDYYENTIDVRECIERVRRELEAE